MTVCNNPLQASGGIMRFFGKDIFWRSVFLWLLKVFPLWFGGNYRPLCLAWQPPSGAYKERHWLAREIQLIQ